MEIGAKKPIRWSFFLLEDLLSDLRIVAAEMDRSMSNIIREALREKFARLIEANPRLRGKLKTVA